MEIAKHRNGVRHSKALHVRAWELRKAGKTHREIAKELGISLGSADIWVRGVSLSESQKQAIQKRRRHRAFTRAEKRHILERLRAYWALRRNTREDLIGKIFEFYRKNGRIPLKREFNAWRMFRQHFRSWNEAIVAAGFDPNPVLFAKKFVSEDGHRCDSFTEKIIDDWLYRRKILHERHRRYGATNMTADFFIQPNIIVEFFGLAGVQKQYDAILQKKKTFCVKNGFRLIEIYPGDIFPVNTLKTILGGI